jgi:hypothetical protein
MLLLACDSWDDPATEGLFGGNSAEEVRHNKLKFFENSLLRYATGCLPYIASEKGREYLHRGFILRHMMMQRSRLFVRENTIGREEPLDPYLSTDLATHLNAYYLNLTAAFDNLAWGIAFELSLAETLSESDWDSRRFCTLTTWRFREALTRVRPTLAAPLESLAHWLDETKAYRDPAAHRLPLSLVSALFSPEDAAQHQRLSSLAAEAVGREDLDEWGRLVHERSLLGRFLPILSAYFGPEGEFIAAPNQIAFDQVEFLKGSSLLISSCLDSRRSRPQLP